MADRTQHVEPVPPEEAACPFCTQRRALSARWPHPPFQPACASCVVWADLELATARMPADLRRALVEVCVWAVASADPPDFNRLLSVMSKVVQVEH